MSDEVDILIGRVESKSYQAAREGYREGTTWLRLSGASVTLRAVGDVSSKLPADGSWAAFQVRGSRSGSIPLILSWGWVNELSNLYNGIPKIDINWVGNFSRGGSSVGGGVQPPGVGVKN